ncbi:MAG: ATP-grasp domain-containing protein [Candidatus Aminicenantaceae bacterium]
MRATEDKIHGLRRRLMYPTLTRLRKAFEHKHHKVVTIDGRSNLVVKVRKARPDIVFNWFSVLGIAQAYVPALLEKMRVPYTGCTPLCHVLAMNKGLANRILQCDRLPVPPFTLVSRKKRKPSQRVGFPVLVKPCSLGSSEGISEASFVESAEKLPAAIDVALAVGQEALITKFIRGRELTVGIIGNRKLQILPILEKHFETKPGAPHIFTEKMKKKYAHWHENVTVPEIEVRQKANVVRAATKAYRSICCNDFARVDIRLDRQGIPWVLDVNTLPGLYPKFSPLTKMANEMGKTVEYLALRILEVARERLCM